jgi:hypothetical protein
MLDASSMGPSFNPVRPAGLRPTLLNGHVNARGSNLQITPANLQVKRNEVDRGGDRVELSDRAQLLERLRQMPAVRADLVQKVRRSIDNDTYETPQRINRAIQALLEDLRSDTLS